MFEKRLQRRAAMSPPLYGVLFLPSGMCQGFITVALGYVLARQGVSVGVIAGLVGLRLLPETWSFLAGPLIDSCLTSVLWYVLSIVALACCAVGFAFLPLQDSALMATLCLASGITAVLSNSAAVAALALTTSDAVRGACAGWRQTGFLGGIGVGGGGALWLVTHAGGLRVASLVLAVLYLLCIWPLLIVRVPPAPRSATVRGAARDAIGALWRLLRTRPGILAVIVVTLPAGAGAAANLLPAVSGDWHASADMVASLTGVLAGIASIPGCITSGYLCDRFPRRTVFMWCALIAAVVEGILALAPRTPVSFAALALVNAALTGLAYSSVVAVIYDRLDLVGAATVGGVLGSLSNVPVVLVTMIIGAVQARVGSVAMLLAEAGLGIASVASYALLVLAWRPPAAVPVPQPAT
jgi:MFS transporter, PAT family, beta-lactamase induction signal transducer AmpG